jgi:quinoprotein glucose dehydrogenase
MMAIRIPKAWISAATLAGALAAFNYHAAAWPSAQDAGKASTVWDGVYTKDQAGRGQAKYTQVCSGCHQGDLSGSDQAPGLAGGDFLDRWDGQSVGDLADRIRTSMPLDDVGSLNIQLSADLTAYLLQANNFPAGQEELKADRAFMKAVAIKRK